MKAESNVLLFSWLGNFEPSHLSHVWGVMKVLFPPLPSFTILSFCFRHFSSSLFFLSCWVRSLHLSGSCLFCNSNSWKDFWVISCTYSMFNVPRVDFTAQAATEKKKRKMSKVSDLLAQFWTDPNLTSCKKTTTIWGECALWWSHVSKRQFCNQNKFWLKRWKKN